MPVISQSEYLLLSLVMTNMLNKLYYVGNEIIWSPTNEIKMCMECVDMVSNMMSMAFESMLSRKVLWQVFE